MSKLRLSNLIEHWLLETPELYGHYHVYHIKKWNTYVLGEWPYEIVEDAKAFVGMTCDGISIALAIMDDHVYYRNDIDTPKFKTMAADRNFFRKIKKDLKQFHTKTHKNKKCEIDADMPL